MKKYSLYLFDFDGTLFDTLLSLKECYKKSILKFNKSFKNFDYDYFLGLSLPRCREFCGISKDKEREFIDYFHYLVHDFKVVKLTKLYSDTLSTFKYLNENDIEYGIVSGSSSKRIKDVLNFFSLDVNKVKVIIGNDSYHIPKPDPEPILIALKKTGYLSKKDKVIYIGDAKQDKEAAVAAGIDYALVKRGNNIGDINSLLDLFK